MKAQPAEYRIKGQGDTREVVDADGALVGRVHRKQRDVVTVRIAATKASLRKATEVYWLAEYADGSPVLRPHGGRMALDHLKDWKEPRCWVRPAPAAVAP